MSTIRRWSARAAFLLVLPLAACAVGSPQSGTLVDVSQSQVVQKVDFGTVVGLSPIMVQGTNPTAETLGTIGGAAAGVAIGDQIGDGSGQVAATIIGGLIGATLGGEAGTRLSRQQSTQWTIQLDSGQTIAVVQQEPGFFRGQRVQVIRGRGGFTRLAPA
ncbi:MAG: glycine zipper 2TM domain-containing protein [Pseudomonadota bacterium]